MKKRPAHLPPYTYTIKVDGCLDRKWADWFEGMTMRYEGKMTVIEGPVFDQAALHGLLARVRDLNLTLLSVDRIESGQEGKE